MSLCKSIILACWPFLRYLILNEPRLSWIDAVLTFLIVVRLRLVFVLLLTPPAIFVFWFQSCFCRILLHEIVRICNDRLLWVSWACRWHFDILIECDHWDRYRRQFCRYVCLLVILFRAMNFSGGRLRFQPVLCQLLCLLKIQLKPSFYRVIPLKNLKTLLVIIFLFQLLFLLIFLRGDERTWRMLFLPRLLWAQLFYVVWYHRRTDRKWDWVLFKPSSDLRHDVQIILPWLLLGY